MPPLTEASYPPPLDGPESDRLVNTIKDWTVANGLSVRPPPTLTPEGVDPQGVLATSVPVTLFPSPFPQACFEQAKVVQEAYNQLYAKISQDEEFIGQVVRE